MCGTINELYNIFLISRGNICLNLFKIPIVLEHAFHIFLVCFFQFKFVSIIKPNKLKSVTCSISILSIFRLSVCIFLFGNIMYLDFTTFSDNVLILSHSLILRSSYFYLFIDRGMYVIIERV